MWAMNGAAYEQVARESKENYIKGAHVLGALLTKRPGGPERFVSFVPDMLGFAAGISGSLLALNGIAMTFGKVLRRRPLRRTLA